MITLNQVSGNNNQIIWVLRLLGESGNAVAYGDFSSSSGWSMTGDWQINGGLASYIYNSEATGTLSRTVSTTTDEYIFSYEVIEKSGTGYTLKLDSSSGIVASDLILDLELGKHTYTIQCNGGSSFKLTISGMGAEDYIYIDNVSLKLANNITYIATRDLELDSNFDGKVLSKGAPFSSVVWNSTIEKGGGAGGVTTYTISISRYIDNPNLDGFFDEFSPSSTGGNLISKIIDLGIVWEGATADKDITWLLRGRVIEYSYSQRSLNITIFQESEITNKEIPYYSVQKDFDNGVSYFRYAPEYGVPIPIVYGSFDQVFTNTNAIETGLYKLAPAIPISLNKVGFIIASHPCYETSKDLLAAGYGEWLFKYIDGVKSYLWIKNSISSNSLTSNVVTSYFYLSNDRGGYLSGNLFIKLVAQSQMTDIDDDTGAIDDDITTYTELNAVGGGDNKLALKTIGSASTSDVGILAPIDSAIAVYWRLSTDGGGNRNYTLNYYNNTLSIPKGDSSPTTGTLTSGTSTMRSHQFGEDTNGKADSSLPWTIEELCGLDFYIENNQTTPGQKIRVYSAYLFLGSIKVYGLNFGRSARNLGGNGRNL